MKKKIALFFVVGVLILSCDTDPKTTKLAAPTNFRVHSISGTSSKTIQLRWTENLESRAGYQFQWRTEREAIWNGTGSPSVSGDRYNLSVGSSSYTGQLATFRIRTLRFNSNEESSDWVSIMAYIEDF
jgi:hypothetical protein